MIAKDIDQITEKILQELIDNAVLERKTIEYKEELPSPKDSDKKEFLADVSSFANASGGDIIYGISEDRKTGIPKSLKGLTIENVDKVISRIESMIRDGIEPRIIGITSKPVELLNKKTAMIIRIPKSWISPHRVSFKGHDKFYSRSTNGKYPIDVAELRVAFSLSETITERIRKFRSDRISKLYANETPVPFYENAKIVLHLIPIVSFNPAQSYNIDIIVSSNSPRLSPMYCSGWNHRYNLDGFLAYSGGRAEESHSYVQLYRKGIIEAVEGLLLKPQNQKLLIPSIAYEQVLIHSLSEYLSILRTLGVEQPIFIFVTLIGVKGYTMTTDRIWMVYDAHKIDREILLLPEVVIESYDVIAKDVLRPCFDAIWNSCGYPRSLNYNDADEWVGR